MLLARGKSLLLRPSPLVVDPAHVHVDKLVDLTRLHRFEPARFLLICLRLCRASLLSLSGLRYNWLGLRGCGVSGGHSRLGLLLLWMLLLLGPLCGSILVMVVHLVLLRLVMRYGAVAIVRVLITSVSVGRHGTPVGCSRTRPSIVIVLIVALCCVIVLLLMHLLLLLLVWGTSLLHGLLRCVLSLMLLLRLSCRVSTICAEHLLS